MTILDRQPEKKNQELGCPLSFENLYREYHLRIYRYLRTHLKNDDDAADLTQQVFFQVWTHLHTYQAAKGSLSTWLFSIAHHRLIDFLRTLRSAMSWETLYEIANPDLNPEDLVISAEITAQVRALIDALSQIEREILALRFAARLSLADIAQLIGKSEEATKKQIARLIRRLQQQYHQLEDLQGQQAPVLLAILHQVYEVALPVAQLASVYQKPLLILAHVKG